MREIPAFVRTHTHTHTGDTPKSLVLMGPENETTKIKLNFIINRNETIHELYHAIWRHLKCNPIENETAAKKV